ncbi:relaxase/mobilization nuclease domain-containing protein [Draconibacterium sp.]|uniref:relaxase/mobilization nuclease domain-containing protein n=1 Tax=Draconibacterium sp. TaxID=1965318 RepID=UPI00356A6B1A
MIAKIIKGKGFKGVVEYVLDKRKAAEILSTDGVRTKNTQTIIQSFIQQTNLNSRMIKTVGHISLNFSAQDRDNLSNPKIVEIANEYMERMGIKDTQYIIVRHYDKEHPHIHLVFNRVNNQGKTISDKNDRFRSEKICKDLTFDFGLYFAKGKENVKEHRLREPDRTKYEIYNTLKEVVPNCKSWNALIQALKEEGIQTSFKYKGRTDEVQGIIFTKNNFKFNGSKVDRQFSFSKINRQIQQNISRESRINTKHSRGHELNPLVNLSLSAYKYRHFDRENQSSSVNLKKKHKNRNRGLGR